MSDLTDDGRRWWFLGAALWVGVHPYAAVNARAALAEYRRDLTAAEIANGRSRRETAEYLWGAGLCVVDGPLSTPAAFAREFGWALAWALCEWSADVPVAPATPEECTARGMAVEKVERIRVNVLGTFT